MTMRRLLRHVRVIAIIVAVAAIAGAAMWPASTEVDVVRVERGPMQVTIDEEGETRIDDRFVVSAPVAGRLQRIELEPGDAVVRGKTVLARLTPAESPLLDPRTRTELSAGIEAARAAVGQAQAERERAAAAVERTRTTVTRQEALAGAGAIARDTLEGSQTALRSAEEALRGAQFAVTRAEYELQLARARLQAPAAGGQPVVVVAPVDGVVLKRFRESEAIVPPGEPLLEIGDPARIEIVADLLSTDAVRIRPGAAVLIEQWGGGEPLRASVRRVEPSGFMKVSALGVEEQRVNVRIDFADARAAAQLLGDAYRVDVRIVTWRADDVVKVPIGALFRRGDDWSVFVVDGDRVRVQPVQIGERNEIDAQITSGLSAGQTVVLHPPDTLADGVRVTVRGS